MPVCLKGATADGSVPELEKQQAAAFDAHHQAPAPVRIGTEDVECGALEERDPPHARGDAGARAEEAQALGVGEP
jgi:hypothetical protein